MNDFRYVSGFLKKHIWKYVFGIMLLMIIDALQLITPLLIGNFTDALKAGTLNAPTILKLIVYILAIAIGVAIGRYGWRMTIVTTAKKLEYWLRNTVFEHLEKMSLNYFNHHKTGDLMAHCTNDISSIRNAFGGGVIMLVDALFMGLMTIAIMMVRIDLKLTLIALIPMPLIAFFIIILGKKVRQRFKEVQEAFSDLTDVAQENFSGVRIIKSFVQEAPSLKHFNEKNQNNFNKNIKLAKLFGMVNPMVGFIAMLSTLIAMIYGGGLVIDGVISIGDFVAFLTYVGMLAWPMMALGFVYNQLQRGQVSLRRINTILETPPEIFDEDVIDALNESFAIKPKLEVKDMTFTYPGSESPVLKNISFNLGEGETLAIVGKTGSGKTTLVNLLLKLYQVPDGTILIGDQDINRIPVKKLRHMMGYVPQDNFLFSKTVLYNVGFGTEGIDETEGTKYTKIAQIHSEIKEFPKGYATELGERGVNMSGGQKQRVSIARALSKKPEIIILDDSLSAVDTKTEESILTHLKEFPKGYATELGERGVNMSGGQKQRVSIARALSKKPEIIILDDSLSAVDTKTEESILTHLKETLVDTTSILIAHRISTIKHASQIIVLEDGEIVERGRHEELLSKDGIYADMYRKQLLEEKISEA